MVKNRNIPNERREEISEKNLNEMEASTLPDIEFKTMMIRKPKLLSENINSMKKDIKIVREKKKQSVMKNTTSEMKNTLEGINSWFGEPED